MDHLPGPGGFAAIFEAWVKDKDMNELYSNVVHNDPKEIDGQGVRDLQEPTDRVEGVPQGARQTEGADP